MCLGRLAGCKECSADAQPCPCLSRIGAWPRLHKLYSSSARNLLAPAIPSQRYPAAQYVTSGSAKAHSTATMHANMFKHMPTCVVVWQ